MEWGQGEGKMMSVVVGGDEGNSVVQVLNLIVVAVQHLAVDYQPEGFGTRQFDGGALTVEHELFDIGTVDVGAVAVFVHQAGELDERHALEEIDFEQAVVVFRKWGAHVVASVETAVAERAEQHVAVEEGFAVHRHAYIVAARSEDALDDARGVGVFAPDDGFAAHVVADFTHHGIETEIAHVDAETVVHFHHVDGVGCTVDKAVDIVEVVDCTVVFDVVVPAAVGVDGYLHVVETDAAAHHFVEGAVAAARVEANRHSGMVGTPASHPTGGVTGALGGVYRVFEVAVGRCVGLDFMGDFGSGILFSRRWVDDKNVFHFEVQRYEFFEIWRLRTDKFEKKLYFCILKLKR